MRDVHPTATAGDGEAIPKRQSKPGDPQDNRIYCAQCGFLFNPDRDLEGNSGGDNQTAGTTITNTVIAVSNNQNNLPIGLRGLASFAVSSRTVKDPVVTSGCPVCGTLNPRAKGRNRNPFVDNNVDLSNR